MMTDSNQTKSTIKLKVNCVNITKVRDSRTGQKSKIQQYVPYKKHTLNIKTQIDEKKANGKRYSLKFNKKKAGVASVLSDEVHSRTKIILQDKDSHFIQSKEKDIC